MGQSKIPAATYAIIVLESVFNSKGVAGLLGAGIVCGYVSGKVGINQSASLLGAAITAVQGVRQKEVYIKTSQYSLRVGINSNLVGRLVAAEAGTLAGRILANYI